MTRDKKILYSVSLLIFAVLLAALFIGVENSKILCALLLIPLTAITLFFIRKRSSLSINKREIFLISAVIGVIFAILVQMSGIFLGFYKNPYFVSSKVILTTVLPLSVIIITTEIIRSVLLAQKNSLASVFAFLSCVIAEVLAFSNIAGITSFNRFMDLVGLTLFPAISSNIYYHYASRQFGAIPNIVFRLITTLYVYFIPNTTAMSDALLSCIMIFLPIIMLALISALYEKKKKNALNKGRKLSVVGAVLTTLIVLSVAMLISCQFKFGAIVIATESMTGEINKGDMIIYERYDGQAIKEGQVIVFIQQQSKIVHRVVKIEHIGNEVRYFTKGDANETWDSGYVTDKDIVGLTDVKLPYVGQPTLWLRDLLESS